MTRYLYNVGQALSCLVNAMIGGNPEHSLSGTIGASILNGGFMARLPMPGPLRRHFTDTAMRNGRV